MSIGRHVLAVLPSAPLSILADWARRFTGTPDPQDQLDALRRAELRAKADIRAVLDRLAVEFDMLSHEVDDAMVQVNETLVELTGNVERDLAYEIEQADQW